MATDNPINPDTKEELVAPKLERERFQKIIKNFTRAYVLQRAALEKEAAFLRMLQTRRGFDTARREVITVDGPEYEAALEEVLGR